MRKIQITFTLLLTVLSFSCNRDSSNGGNGNNSFVTDVYVAGSEEIATDYYIPRVWKNGVATSFLTSGLRDASAKSIFVVGNDVYVAGTERFSSFSNIAKVWKNGVATDLTNGVKNSGISCIYVARN